jgi:hypothetical protein
MTRRHARDIVDYAAGPLDEVLAAEQANARLIDEERAKAAAWLAAACAEIDRAADAARAGLDAAATGEVAAAQAKAEAAAAAIVATAERLAARLRALDDARVAAIVRARLPAILPGAMS